MHNENILFICINYNIFYYFNFLIIRNIFNLVINKMFSVEVSCDTNIIQFFFNFICFNNLNIKKKNIYILKNYFN